MMRAPITSAQAMSHPTVVETINALGAIADEHREHKERLRSLLSEVAAQYTRDDDLPDDLLPRIDAALALPDNAAMTGPVGVHVHELVMQHDNMRKHDV